MKATCTVGPSFNPGVGSFLFFSFFRDIDIHQDMYSSSSLFFVFPGKIYQVVAVHILSTPTTSILPDASH